MSFKHTFLQMPREIVIGYMNGDAALIYTIISDKCRMKIGRCMLNQTELAELCQISRPTLIKHLQTMEWLGLISVSKGAHGSAHFKCSPITDEFLIDYQWKFVSTGRKFTWSEMVASCKEFLQLKFTSNNSSCKEISA